VTDDVPDVYVVISQQHLPMLAALGWELRARTHQEGTTLSPMTAAATRTARPVIVANQPNVARSAVARRYVQ
jgi:hypothetical protein